MQRWREFSNRPKSRPADRARSQQNLGRYNGFGPVSLPEAVQVRAKDQGAVAGFFKSVLDFIGKNLVKAFQHPPWFGGPFMFMIFARYLFADEKNQGFGEAVILRLNSYEDYRGRREDLEARREGPLTISFQGKVETSALNSFYVDEIVTRGEAPLREQKVRVTTTAFAEDPTTSRFVNPTGPEKVKGYRLRVGEAGEEAEVILFTQDRVIAEEIHQQVATEYEKMGSAQAAIDWLIHQGPLYSSLFEPPTQASPALSLHRP
jgi:hypothetical protein